LVAGWHIGIEMVPRFAGMRGLMVVGTPPVVRNGMADGFQRSPHMQLAGQEHLSETDIEAFVRAIFGKSAEPFLHKAVARADGRFRKTLFEAARAGSGVDQRQIVETNPVPLAVVNGSEDRFVKLDYLDTLAMPICGRTLSSPCRARARAVLGRPGRFRSYSGTFLPGCRKWPSRAPCVSYALSSINA